MVTCAFRKYKKEFLCPSDLTHYTKILSRELLGDDLFSDEQNSTELTQILELWSAIDTGNYLYNYSPVNGVNDTKRPTHKISFRVSDLNGLQIDTTKHIIEIDNIKFRIIELVNFNMSNTILDCYCIIRGSDGYITQS